MLKLWINNNQAVNISRSNRKISCRSIKFRIIYKPVIRLTSNCHIVLLSALIKGGCVAVIVLEQVGEHAWVQKLGLYIADK